ncbi:MAG: hypothetical protein K6C69_08000 [Lachnospiraceae bacterium]|nr:hypothetical protein [Lachnospiraceae bacterium]
MAHVYMIGQKVDYANNGGSKAMQDVYQVFSRIGIRFIPGVPKAAPKVFKAFDLITLCWYFLFILRKEDYLLFIFPDNELKLRFVYGLAKMKKVKVICFINDVNSIRDGHFDDPATSALIRKEMELIGRADIILAPNKGAEAFYRSQGIRSRIVNVGCWDYLLEVEKKPKLTILDPTSFVPIAFAGNLDKAPFVHHLEDIKELERIRFELWGKSSQGVMRTEHVIYHEVLTPRELIDKVSECYFGLVWDGTGVHACSGGLGEYLKYNNSHKCGLYLAAGLPVFVWSQSGLSYFVKETGCGYTIDSLDDIPAIIKRLTKDPKEYITLCTNVGKVSKKIQSGEYLKKAMVEAVGKDSLYFPEEDITNK